VHEVWSLPLLQERSFW